MELLSNIELLLQQIERPSDEALSALEQNEALFDSLTNASLGIPVSIEVSGSLDQTFFETHSSRMEHQVVVHDLGEYEKSEIVREAFNRFLKYSRHTWIDLFRKGGSALILDKEKYISNYAKAGGKLIEVQGVVNIDREKTIEHGLAYGLIFTDKDSISDLEDFPKDVRDAKNLIRLNEVINVSMVGNFHYPSGSLIDLVFEEIIAIAEKKEREEEAIIITRIVSGERKEGVKEETREFAYTWSQKALSKRNFEHVGNIEFDVVLDAHPGVREIPLKATLIDGIYVWRKSNQTKAKQIAEQRKERLESYILDQILCTGSFPIGSNIACFSDSFNNYLDYALAEKHNSSGVVVAHMDNSFVPTYRQNLEHVVAGSSGVITKAKSLDAIFSNNILRSAALNGEYKLKENSAIYLYHQLGQLKSSGHYAAREVLIPSNWPNNIIMELNADSANYFKKYCDDVNLPCQEIENNKFAISKAEAIKFVFLINPYRDKKDYEELKKLPAPFFTPEEYLAVLRAFDVRIDNAKSVFTEFVQENFVNDLGIKFYNFSGERLNNPPNQFELIGRKVKIDAPVAVRAKEIRELEESKYISSRYYKNNHGEVRQLISRKGRNVFSLFPISYINGEPAVPIREAYPRGIPLAFFGKNSNNIDFSMDSTIRSGFNMESISVALDDYNDDNLYASIVTALKKYVLLKSQDIPPKDELLASLSGKSIPSSSSIDEVWRSVYFVLDGIDYTQVLAKDENSFSDKSLIRTVLLKDIIGIGESAGPVSGALLQFAYEYYINNSLEFPKWNGKVVKFDNQKSGIEIYSNIELHHRGLRSDSSRWKETKAVNREKDFYELKEIDFVQVDGRGNEIEGIETLEAATLSKKTGLTNNTYVICPCAIVNGRPVVFLETRDDLPLVYEELGLVKPEVIPAYRVKIETALKDKKRIDVDLIKQFENDCGVRVVKKDGSPIVYNQSPELLVAPGIIPERAALKLVEIDLSNFNSQKLRAYYLEDLAKNSSTLFGGHTKNAIFRAWHSLSKK